MEELKLQLAQCEQRIKGERALYKQIESELKRLQRPIDELRYIEKTKEWVKLRKDRLALSKQKLKQIALLRQEIILRFPHRELEVRRKHRPEPMRGEPPPGMAPQNRSKWFRVSLNRFKTDHCDWVTNELIWLKQIIQEEEEEEIEEEEEMDSDDEFYRLIDQMT